MMGLRKTAAEQASQLLEAQHKALLSGDLDRLAPMAAELERAFQRLGHEGGDLRALSRIKDAAARNARLLIAAQAGVSLARGHLMSSRTPELTTYDAQGRARTEAQGNSRTLSRR